MVLENLTGVLSLGALIMAMVLLVPWEEMRRLLLPAFLFGVIFPFMVIGVMQNLLGLWSYRGVDPVTIAGIPVFLSLAWAPALIIYAYLMARYRYITLRVLLLLSTGAGVVAIQYFHLINNNLTFQNWSLAASFFLAVAIHTVILVVLQLMGYLRLRDLTRS